MAGRIGMATLTAEEALATGTAETLLQIVAATNHAVKILAWGVFFDGAAPTAEPAVIKLARQTTAGTSSALTVVKWDDSGADTFDTTALQDFSAEPTGGDVLEMRNVHQQMWYECFYPIGQEPIVGAGDRVGIVATPSANVNALAYIRFEE